MLFKSKMLIIRLILKFRTQNIIQMPDLDGYEATRQIRQFNTDIVIIAQTAYTLTGDRGKSINAGCNDYIAKPIMKDQLMKLLQKYFKS